MLKAEFPQRTCREAVWGEQAYTCELPDVHPGPHASFSLRDTVERRDDWERDNPDWQQQVWSADFIV